MEIVLAAVIGLVVGSAANRLIVREPGYVIRDLATVGDDVDEALLDELEEVGDLPPVPVLALVRPSTWQRRWFPVVEVVMAGAWAASVAVFGVGAEGVAVLFLATVLVTLAAIDFRVLRIPDRINFPSMGIGVALLVVASFVIDDVDRLQGMAIGGVGYAGTLFLAHLLYPRGMGWGDVKLAWLMGFYLGWFGWATEAVAGPVLGVVQLIVWAFGLGSILGLVVGLPYAVMRRSTKTSFPFGPSLAAGCLAIVLAADSILV